MFPDAIILDFDSTIIQEESLDELARISLENHPEKTERLEEISSLTHLGMEGKLGFGESLSQRLALLNVNRFHIKIAVENLKYKLTLSFERNRDFFQYYRDKIYVFSGGFREIIFPILEGYLIKKTHIYANDFIYEKNGKVLGVDPANPLSRSGGKSEQLNRLALGGEIHIIGDGYNDYLLKESVVTGTFFAFTENVSRPEVCRRADKVISSFDEYISLLTS